MKDAISLVSNIHPKERSMKTDSELRRDVERELEWDPSIDARNIAVAAKNGVVTLAGHVPTYSDKWRAESIAKRVAGLTAIANEIEVKLKGERTDTDIAEAARTALRLDGRVPADSVKVIVGDEGRDPTLRRIVLVGSFGNLGSGRPANSV
jgi:osmotically-inducible protein OsmY